MKTRLKLVPAILGCLFTAAPALAQGSAKLAVGPDAGGYLCPDGRQLYVKSCYDNSPDANCGVVHMHLPVQNGFQREGVETRSKLTPSVAACKVYPLEFRNDGTVGLVIPKSPPAQQVASSTTATARAVGDKLRVTDGMAIGREGVPSSLVRTSPTGAPRIIYVDEASRSATSQADVVTIWYLGVYVDGKPPIAGMTAVWTEYAVNCKQRSYELRSYIALDRQATVQSAIVGDVRDTVRKGQVNETVADIACKPEELFNGSRFASASAAIADAFASPAPKLAAKPPPPAPIRLPVSENEKLFFRMVKEGMFQGAVNALLKSPEDKRKSLLELTDEQGMTPLHWATTNRSAAALRWLLDRGSKTDLADKKGRTPLRIALDNKDTQAMSVLLNIGRADAGFALPDRAEEMKGIKKTDDLIDFMIKAAGAKSQPG